MSGDQVFVRTADTFGIGAGQVVDGFSGATPLGQVAIAGKEMIGSFQAVDVLGNPISTWDAFIGLIPGSIGETSVLAILIGAVILLVTGIASWKTMVSVFVGGAFMSLIFNMIGTTVAMCVSPLDHLFLGGFAFGAVFMATDPVTSARTETGKYLWFPCRCYGHYYSCVEPGLSRGYDARYPVDERVRSADRLLCCGS